MGCYETIWVPCPKCGEKYPAQSKSGPCALGNFTLESAPDDVVADVNRHAPFTCEKCGTEFSVELTYPKTMMIQRKVVEE